jgi:hypothetical protein
MQTIGSKMAVRMSAPIHRLAVLSRNIICLLLTLVSVKDGVNPRAYCGWKDYVNCKNSPHRVFAIFRLVA